MSASRIQLVSQIASEHGGALILYARQWSDQAEDLVQESLLELFEAQSWPERPVAWLHGVVRYRALNRYRDATRRRRRESAVAHRGEPWFVPDPGQRLMAEEAMLRMQQLPEDRRETVIARIWGGLSFAEIGELMSVEPSTAQRRFVAAIETLRSQIDASTPARP